MMLHEVAWQRSPNASSGSMCPTKAARDRFDVFAAARHNGGDFSCVALLVVPFPFCMGFSVNSMLLPCIVNWSLVGTTISKCQVPMLCGQECGECGATAELS